MMCNEQIGFQKGGWTADHIFRLKFLFCIYFKYNKNIYACLINLQKAFGNVIHPALLHKSLIYGIGSKFSNMIASMYENNILQMRTVGVKQELSPNIFKIYLNDIIDAFSKEVHGTIKLGSKGFNCLLYANDIILLSESEACLQKCLDKLSQYCN